MSEQGSVRWFNNKKGYGFIQKDSDKKDIFVHFSAIGMEGYKTLKTGDVVTFEIADGEKGPQAANVVATGETVAIASEKPASEPTEDQETE